MSIDVIVLSSAAVGDALSIDVGSVSSVDTHGNRLLGSFYFVFLFMTCNNLKTNISTKLIKTN